MASIHSLLERLHGGETMLSPGLLKAPQAFIKNYSSDVSRILQLFNWQTTYLASCVPGTMPPSIDLTSLVERKSLNYIKAYSYPKFMPAFLLTRATPVNVVVANSSADNCFTSKNKQLHQPFHVVNNTLNRWSPNVHHPKTHQHGTQ